MSAGTAVPSLDAHLTASRLNTYLALEDMDFVWDESEVIAFDAMWKQGTSMKDIADTLGRDIDEVLVLAIDRARKGQISSRPGGVFGGMDMTAQRKPRRTFTKEDYLQSHEDGLSDSKIAKEYGTTPQTVLYWKRKWGLK